ncbi:MAG: PLP-dependent aspartate aminotransferase family protein [Planctomycetota bacterium]|nr:PLP-dependent aspartate aminotransferase family protein [Planctomycetota bacterium]
MAHIEPHHGFSTRCIHAGQTPDPVTGAVMPPVSFSSTYAQSSPGEHAGFEYSRSHNPTRYAWERCIARLEGSELCESDDVTYGGFAFASGLAAIATLLDHLPASAKVVASDDLYGGTHRLFRQVRAHSAGLRFEFVDASDPNQVADAVDAETALIWVETPTNPMLKVVDLAAIAAIGKEHGILTACDNTFCSPAIQQPLTHGIDVVMHSSTKYLGGHSDVVGGVLVTGNPELATKLRFLQNSVGAVIGPMDAYLNLRGTKTLGIRMARHSETGLKLASMLEAHPKVERVVYPGLDSHPQHAIAQKQMRTGGGMITATLAGGLEASRTFLESVNLFTLAESLGGVESLIEHPAIMTHASVPAADRAALGIDDGLVRFSCGIEEADDLLEDVDHALGKIG